MTALIVSGEDIKDNKISHTSYPSIPPQFYVVQKETEGMGDDSNEDEDVVVAADKKYPAPHTVVVGDV